MGLVFSLFTITSTLFHTHILACSLTSTSWLIHLQPLPCSFTSTLLLDHLHPHSCLFAYIHILTFIYNRFLVHLHPHHCLFVYIHTLASSFTFTPLFIYIHILAWSFKATPLLVYLQPQTCSVHILACSFSLTSLFIFIRIFACSHFIYFYKRFFYLRLFFYWFLCKLRTFVSFHYNCSMKWNELDIQHVYVHWGFYSNKESTEQIIIQLCKNFLPPILGVG